MPLEYVKSQKDGNLLKYDGYLFRKEKVGMRNNGFLPMPTTLLDLQIPNEYKFTHNGQQFLLHDSGPVDNRILVFSTVRNLELLSNQHHWFGDGTFKTSPPLFAQLYTIHGLRNNVNIPLVFALLPNKSAATYDSFSNIKNLNQHLNPESFLTDFEIASITSFTRQFPNSVNRGCFFILDNVFGEKVKTKEKLEYGT
ncbi:hypothetical protein RN001_002713 [Aquatica leii]|uniref:MULE transposase domain-containing protein n=1 Tax=Aquatica leii TaxID=1421715 RepID=A0AAN7SKB7_9COLE|nr:hypothetical protein RN001_002713 [Aquatica leii]